MVVFLRILYAHWGNLKNFRMLHQYFEVTVNLLEDKDVVYTVPFRSPIKGHTCSIAFIISHTNK